MKAPTVRIYGPVLKGSWATLTRGFEQALRAYGGLAGIVPTDSAYDPDDSYDGAEADVALVLGPPGGMAMARSIGDHRLVYFMFAPNTTTIPKHIANGILGGCDIVLVPSDEAWSTMAVHVEENRLRTVYHGIDPDVLFPMPHPNPEGRFVILHHAGSALERKGTRELIEAFRTWEHRDASELVVSCPTPIQQEAGVTWSQSCGPHMAQAQYQHAHAICQPSRAEGFGLVPFEARACGRPVIATDVGQQNDAVWFAIWQQCDEYTPLMCELGEDARVVTPEAIQKALTVAYEQRHQALVWAMNSANEFRARWSWTAVTAEWYFKDIPVDLARQTRTRRQQDTIGG